MAFQYERVSDPGSRGWLIWGGVLVFTGALWLITSATVEGDDPPPKIATSAPAASACEAELAECRAANYSSTLALEALAWREDGCARFLTLDAWTIYRAKHPVINRAKTPGSTGTAADLDDRPPASGPESGPALGPVDPPAVARPPED